MSETVTCAECGREGTSAYRPFIVRVIGELVTLHRCSNTGACGQRRCSLGRNDLWRIGVEARYRARFPAATQAAA